MDLEDFLLKMRTIKLIILHFTINDISFLTHACHRNVLRHFRFKQFSMGKPYKFGVTTINRKIPNAFKG